MSDSAEGVRALLEGGCDASVLNKASETALCVAARMKSRAAVGALRERGVRGDKHMLLAAAASDEAGLVEESLEAGANVNAQDKWVGSGMDDLGQGGTVRDGRGVMAECDCHCDRDR